MRIMLDTNVFDKLIADDPTLKVVLESIATSRMVIVSTHIQRDELLAVPDPLKRAKLLTIPTEQAPTNGIIWDVSKWDEAAWGDSTTNHVLESLIIGNNKHARDALIGATAATTVDLLVTEDCTFARRVKRAKPGLTVVDYTELVTRLNLKFRHC